MPRTLALQMDPLPSIRPRSDTSLLLGVEAQARGYRVFQYVPSALSAHGGEVTARAVPVRLMLDDSHWFEAGEPVSLPLSECDVVLMRQDPPFNMDYITATYLLERADPRTRVFNHPTAVRNHPEKLFPLEFPDYIPPTLISTSAEDITAFHRERRDIVLKPLYGYGGAGIIRVRAEGENLGAVLELMLAGGEPLIAQPFLPEVRDGERRMIVIDGEIKAIMGRIPAAGEIRANLALGGTAVVVEMTPRQKLIGEAVGAVLKQRGLLLAGLDFIGDCLIEINITSPTGLQALNALYGLRLEVDFWDAAERYL